MISIAVSSHVMDQQVTVKMIDPGSTLKKKIIIACISQWFQCKSTSVAQKRQ